MGNIPDGHQRRILRSAVHNGDTAKLKNLVNKGIDINTVISEAFWDTPLTFAVKYGYLEVVEFLVSHPMCKINEKDRNNHSALDEAIKGWLQGMCKAGEKHNSAKRYRILKCVLSAGTTEVTSSFLDLIIYSCLNSLKGHRKLEKLVKVICDKGQPEIKSVTYSVFMTYKFTHDYLLKLLEAGAIPEYYLIKEPARPFMPLENAFLLLRATNNSEMLSRIECDTSCFMKSSHKMWVNYQHLLRLLTICGYALQLYIMNFLYCDHATFYKWVTAYRSTPKPLHDLCRVAVRQHLHPNVLVGVHKLPSLPESIKSYLTLNDWLFLTQ